MALNSDNNRLFVADRYNNRVILSILSDLTWGRVLFSQERQGIIEPFRFVYDANKKRLYVVSDLATSLNAIIIAL